MSNIAIAGDTSGTVTLQAPAIAGTTTLTLPATSGTLVTTASGQALTSPTITGTATLNGVNMTPYSMKNRIINGGMQIDQRYVGTATANTINGYVLDRWYVGQIGGSTGKIIAQQNAGSVTPPAGFSNYLGITSQSAYTVGASQQYSIQQPIEGYTISDLAWGTASAKTVTLSFWVRSSLTGTFAVCLRNSTPNRSYVSTYTISSANTWEYKTITVAGDTSGTWNVTNSTGIYIDIDLGSGSSLSTTANTWTTGNYTTTSGVTNLVGTNGATLYVTGVQLEVGSVASAFEWRPYGEELRLCQRYYEKCFSQSYKPANGFSSDVVWQAGTGAWIAYTTGSPGSIRFNAVPFAVVKRTAPSMTQYSASNATVAGNWCRYNAGWTDVTGFSFYVQDNCWSAAAAAAVTANNSYLSSGGWTADAEL